MTSQHRTLRQTSTQRSTQHNANNWEPLGFKSQRRTPALQMRRASGVTGERVLAFRERHASGIAAVQMKNTTARPSADIHTTAQEGLKGNAQTLPHLNTIQKSFGEHTVTGVQAYIGGPAGKANTQMGSLAYATRESIAFKQSPDLHTAAHEAAHIIQQRGGVQLKGGVGEIGDTYERHADHVADAVVQGKSAQGLLDTYAGSQKSQAGPVQMLQFKGKPKKPTTADEAKYWIDAANTQMGVYVNAIDALSTKKEIPAVLQKALAATSSRFTQFSNKMNAVLNGADKANTLLTIGSGMFDFVQAFQNNDSVGMAKAAGDTAVHVAMGSNPVTAVLDGVLSVIFGGDWPSKSVLKIFAIPGEIIEMLSELIKKIGNMLKTVTSAVRGIVGGIVGAFTQALSDTVDALIDPTKFSVHPKYKPSKGAPSPAKVDKAIQKFVKAVAAGFKMNHITKVRDGDKLAGNKVLEALLDAPTRETLKHSYSASVHSKRAAAVLYKALVAVQPAMKTFVKKDLTLLRQQEILDILIENKVIVRAG